MGDSQTDCSLEEDLDYYYHNVANGDYYDGGPPTSSNGYEQVQITATYGIY